MLRPLAVVSAVVCTGLVAGVGPAPAVMAGGASPSVAPADNTVQGEIGPRKRKVSKPADVRKYWGLPRAVGGSRGQAPRTYSAKTFPGYVRYAGSKKYLPGFHPKKIKVLRGYRPRLSGVQLSSAGSRYRLATRLKVRGAVRGPARRKAVEQVLVSVRLLGEAKNPSRRPLLARKQVWRKITSGSPQTMTLTMRLGASMSRTMARMTRAQRNRAMIIDVLHIIDVDRVKVQGRWTADHLKATSFDLATIRDRKRMRLAASYGDDQGFGLTVVNDDYYGNDIEDNGIYATWGAPNLMLNPVSCMESQGQQGSNTDAFNITMMTPGQTVEAYIQASGGDQQPSNQAPAAQVVAKNVGEDIAESAVEYGLDIPLGWSNVAFDVFETLAELAFNACDANPGMFTISAADNYGNATQQGYSLFATYNNEAYPGTGQPPAFPIGGMADVRTAQALWDEFGVLGYKQKNAFAVANYINDDYLANNFGSGPTSVQYLQYRTGGDSGLALQTTAEQFDLSGSFPQGQLTLAFNAGCSSTFGGQFDSSFSSDPRTQYSAVIPSPTITNPCTGPNSPVGNPYPAPAFVGGQIPTMNRCQAQMGQPLALSAGSLNVPNAEVQYAWYWSTGSQNAQDYPPRQATGWTQIATADNFYLSPTSEMLLDAGATQQQIDDGLYLTGVVTYSSKAGAVSQTTGAVALGNASTSVDPFPTVLPTLSAQSATMNEPISVVEGGAYCPRSSTSASYAWMVNGRIVGTGPSYTPTLSDGALGATLYLVIYPYSGQQSMVISGPIEILDPQQAG